MSTIRKNALLLMAGLVLAAPAMAAQPTPTAARPDSILAPQTPWADAPLAILYNQYDNSGTVSLASQNFEAVYDAYDNQLADDFNVPANTSWKISGVGVQGFVTADQPASFNLLIYTDDDNPPGMPGTLRLT